MNSIISNTFKVNAAFSAAAVVTLGLFYLMQLLVKHDFVLEEGEPPIPIQEITMPDIEIKTIPDAELPEPIELIDEIEPLIREVTGPQEFSDPFARLPQPIDTPIDMRTGFSLEASGALVLRQVNPVYPGYALNRGIEGFVLIEFDISPTGSVVDPRVIYAEPENVFNRAALNAIGRWKFKAKIERGNEVFQYNERRRISFTIGD